MTDTLSKDLYAPEVWSDLAFAAFKGQTALFNLASQNDQLVGQPGETINFPAWNALSEMEDLDEMDDLVPEAMSQKNSKAVIKEAGKAVSIKDRAQLVGMGNAQDETIRQFGILAARKIDTDLFGAATTVISGGITYADSSPATPSSPLIYNAGAGTGISYKGVNSAMGLFGDDADAEDFAGIVVNSSERTTILNDDSFIAASQGNGTNGAVNRRFLGFLAGLPVYVSDRIPVGKSLVLKTGALGIFFKRRPIVERDRDILARATVISTNMHYAVKRVSDEGVLLINWNTAGE